MPSVMAVISTIDTFSVAELISRFVRGVAFYSMALWLIAHTGDSVYKWVLANPNDAAIGAVSFAIVWMIVHFSSGLWRNQQRIAC
jgi:hypothetical protein